MKCLRALLPLALLVSGARAEVRLQHRGDEIALRVTHQHKGIWTPVGSSAREELLNPYGDLLGDGVPVYSQSGRALAVAWFRPSAQGIVVLTVDPSGRAQNFVPSNGPVTGLTVQNAGDGWLIVWSDADGFVKSLAVGIDALGSPEVAQAGDLLSAEVIEDRLIVASLVGREIHVGVFGIYNPLPVPIPIQLRPFALRDHALSFEDDSLIARIEALDFCTKPRAGVAVLSWVDGTDRRQVEVQDEIIGPTPGRRVHCE